MKKTSHPTLTVASLTYHRLAKMLDHSLLRPDATNEELVAGCELARAYNVASVCIKPTGISLAAQILRTTDIHVGTVIGFPHGSTATAVKAYEANKAIADGATELDVVINIGWLRSGLDAEVYQDLHSVVDASSGRAIVKVILENAYLTEDQKRRGCIIAEEAGAHFVKSSTGFAPTGATVEDIRLMRASVSPAVQVKAAGGIQTLTTLIEMVNAGATRIGTSSTRQILEEFTKGQEVNENRHIGLIPQAKSIRGVKSRKNQPYT